MIRNILILQILLILFMPVGVAEKVHTENTSPPKGSRDYIVANAMPHPGDPPTGLRTLVPGIILLLFIAMGSVHSVLDDSEWGAPIQEKCMGWGVLTLDEYENRYVTEYGTLNCEGEIQGTGVKDVETLLEENGGWSG